MCAEARPLPPLRAHDPTVLGPYTLSARLGSGGMGTVYLGTDDSGRQAAVKVLRDSPGLAPASVQRFAREVVAVATIDSPRVARLLDADPVAEQPWLATEYVPGPTLTAAVSAGGPMPAGLLHALATGLAEGLCAVHEAGVVHRDLKPGNVMLAPDGPKIIDFGIVAGLPGTVTESGIVLGSVGYLAPELLVEREPPTSKADVFSWALTLVFAASGRPPFGDGPLEAMLYRTVSAEPDLRALPRPIRGVVAAALRKQPRRRPGAEELLALLREAPARTALPFALSRPRRLVGAVGADAGTGTDGRTDLGSGAGTDTGAGTGTGTRRLTRPRALTAAVGAASADGAAVGTGTGAGGGMGRRWAATATAAVAAARARWRLLVPVASLLAAVTLTATVLLTDANGSSGTAAGLVRPPARPAPRLPAAAPSPAPSPGPSEPAQGGPTTSGPTAGTVEAGPTGPATGAPAAGSPRQRRTARPQPTATSPAAGDDGDEDGDGGEDGRGRRSSSANAAARPGVCANSQRPTVPLFIDWTRLWCGLPLLGEPAGG